MIEKLTIGLIIIGVIVLWEVVKYLGWEFINWLITKQADKYENQRDNDVSKCPYLNNKNKYE
tara:strand:+ start:59 stop:244 length:186 start_codon:yes stop_codon:yes gene_type:complete